MPGHVPRHLARRLRDQVRQLRRTLGRAASSVIRFGKPRLQSGIRAASGTPTDGRAQHGEQRQVVAGIEHRPHQGRGVDDLAAAVVVLVAAHRRRARRARRSASR